MVSWERVLFRPFLLLSLFQGNPAVTFSGRVGGSISQSVWPVFWCLLSDVCAERAHARSWKAHLFFPFVKTKMLCFLVLHFEGSNPCFSQVRSGSSRTTRKQTVTAVVAGGQRPWQASRLLSEDTALVPSAITSVAHWFFTVAGHTRGTAVD